MSLAQMSEEEMARAWSPSSLNGNTAFLLQASTCAQQQQQQDAYDLFEEVRRFSAATSSGEMLGGSGSGEWGCEDMQDDVVFCGNNNGYIINSINRSFEQEQEDETVMVSSTPSTTNGEDCGYSGEEEEVCATPPQSPPQSHTKKPVVVVVRKPAATSKTTTTTAATKRKTRDDDYVCDNDDDGDSDYAAPVRAAKRGRSGTNTNTNSKTTTTTRTGSKQPRQRRASSSSSPSTVVHFIPTHTTATSTTATAPTTTSSSSSTRVRISTMTAVFDLNQQVDLHALALYFPGNVVYDPKGTAFETDGGKKKSSFMNQAGILFRIGASVLVSVSLFRNGRIKLAGCRSEEQCRKMMHAITWRVKASVGPEGSAVPNPNTLACSQLRVVMTKADFDIGFTVSLAQCATVLGERYAVRYDPQAYSGLICPVMRPGNPKPLNVMVFASGKAFVAGNCSAMEVKGAFDTVRVMLEDNRETVSAPMPVRNRKRRGASSSL